MKDDEAVYALCLTRKEMMAMLRAFNVFAEIMIPKVEEWRSWLDMEEDKDASK